MSNEITAQQNNPMIAVIERVALDPNVDLAKLEKMLDMQERILERDARQAFAADMAAMQAEMPRVFKLATGHNITYARLEDINDAVRPVLQKFGFCVTFDIKQPTPDAVVIAAICSHKLGHTQSAELSLPLDTSGSKNKVQAVGSTISYGKRYTMCALLNISTGDDTNGAGLGKSAGEISGSTTINGNQIAEIIAKCAEKEIDFEDLIAVAKVENLQQIPAHRFAAAMNWINSHA